MKKTRRSFTDEFKREAVKLVKQPGAKVTHIARDLGIEQSVPRRWMEQERGGVLEMRPNRPIRSEAAGEVERLQRDLRRVTMERDIQKKALGYFAKDPPGFTAPKLLWVARHEPHVFERVAKVLLPKDYLRLRLAGEYASDMSDAAGMLWLDMARRDWNDELLAATELSRRQMPALFEGPHTTGLLRVEIAQRFNLRRIPVVAGAGDNAAGAIGMGIVRPGQGMLSLGTSGVFFVATDGFLANPAQGVHSFCHALPQTWHLMSVMLSAASCLDHARRLTGMPDIASLLLAAERRGLTDATPYYLPYLNGERTPHNNPAAKAVYFGLDTSTEAADLANATLEGVGQSLLDGIEAVEAAGVRAEEIVLVGGGSRSEHWAQMLADILDRPLRWCAARAANSDRPSVRHGWPVWASMGDRVPSCARYHHLWANSYRTWPAMSGTRGVDVNSIVSIGN